MRFFVASSDFVSAAMSDPPSGYDPVATDFLVLIGRIIIAWSRIERALEVGLVGGQPFAPKHYRRGKAPINFKGKIAAFREICPQVAETSKILPWINQRLDDLLDLGEKRHTIIHGYFHGISAEAEPQIYFRRAQPLTGEAGDRLLATRSELENYIKQLRQADFDFMMLTWTLHQGYRKERQKASTPVPPYS